MKKYITNLIAAAFLLTAFLPGCKEKLDTTDKNSPTTESYFKTAAELQNGVNAVYSSLRSAQNCTRNVSQNVVSFQCCMEKA